MGRRSKLEIYFDILEVIDKGEEKPTRIMYETHLSWLIASDALDSLVNGGFILLEQKDTSKKHNYKRYFITGKGINALAFHKKSLIGLIPLTT